MNTKRFVQLQLSHTQKNRGLDALEVAGLLVLVLEVLIQVGVGHARVRVWESGVPLGSGEKCLGCFALCKYDAFAFSRFVS